MPEGWALFNPGAGRDFPIHPANDPIHPAKPRIHPANDPIHPAKPRIHPANDRLTSSARRDETCRECARTQERLERALATVQWLIAEYVPAVKSWTEPTGGLPAPEDHLLADGAAPEAGVPEPAPAGGRCVSKEPTKPTKPTEGPDASGKYASTRAVAPLWGRDDVWGGRVLAGVEAILAQYPYKTGVPRPAAEITHWPFELAQRAWLHARLVVLRSKRTNPAEAFWAAWGRLKAGDASTLEHDALADPEEAWALVQRLEAAQVEARESAARAQVQRQESEAAAASAHEVELAFVRLPKDRQEAIRAQARASARTKARDAGELQRLEEDERHRLTVEARAGGVAG